MRNKLVTLVGIVTAAACAGDPPAADELSGSWALVAVCLYDREGPPCDSVRGPAAEELTFLPAARYLRRNPDEEGSYTVERRQTPAGGEEVLIRFDDGAPAQLHVMADSLVVSWAYVDGAEMRYVPSENR